MKVREMKRVITFAIVMTAVSCGRDLFAQVPQQATFYCQAVDAAYNVLRTMPESPQRRQIVEDMRINGKHAADHGRPDCQKGPPPAPPSSSSSPSSGSSSAPPSSTTDVLGEALGQLAAAYLIKSLFSPSTPKVSKPDEIRSASKGAVVDDGNGKKRPAAGFKWLNPSDSKDLRVIPSEGVDVLSKGKVKPAEGFAWVNLYDTKDMRVRSTEGVVQNAEGQWTTAPGFEWVNPQDQNDFRVRRSTAAANAIPDVPNNFPTLGATFQSLKLFESGSQVPKDQRVYATSFTESARFINAEVTINFPAPGRAIDAGQVICSFIDAAGNIVGRAPVSMSGIQANWTIAYNSNGYGAQTPGFWKAGNYRVDCAVDGHIIGSQAFRVTGAAAALTRIPVTTIPPRADLESGYDRATFGMTPEQLQQAYWPGSSRMWNQLQVAGEYKDTEVRYLWINFSKTMPYKYEAMISQCANTNSYAAWLFDRSGLFRVSLRFSKACAAAKTMIRDFALLLDAPVVAAGSSDAFSIQNRNVGVAGYQIDDWVFIEFYKPGSPRYVGQIW